MQEGVLRKGDLVRYSVTAQKTLKSCTDNKIHTVLEVKMSQLGDELAVLDGDKPEWLAKRGTAVSHLKLVRRFPKVKKVKTKK